MPEPPSTLAPHIGTTDVDIGITVAIATEDVEMYQTLCKVLKDLKFEQQAQSFAWAREVDGHEVVLELFCPVHDPDQAGKVQRKPVDKGGSKLTALGIYGVDLVELDVERIVSDGDLLDQRGKKDVTLNVCGPCALLCLKGQALENRLKQKDGYDVVWVLKAWGVEPLVMRFFASGLHENDAAKEALALLGNHFADTERTGPIGWVDSCGFQGEERARELQEAVGLVNDFVSEINKHL